MDWRAEGVLLNTRKHGETSVIIDVLTAERGRHAGVVRGGVSRKIAPLLQPGAQLDLVWRARLEEHLGTFSVEPLRSRAWILGDRGALAGLNAVTALLLAALPEREPHPRLYQRSVALLDLLGQAPLWPVAYLRWELALLDDLGFGLDLERCAISAQVDDLAYVSPRTGRAVARAAAGDWADRLLPLVAELRGGGDGRGVVDGLRTTGHFLDKALAPLMSGKPVPAARARLVAFLQSWEPDIA